MYSSLFGFILHAIVSKTLRSTASRLPFSSESGCFIGIITPTNDTITEDAATYKTLLPQTPYSKDSPNIFIIYSLDTLDFVFDLENEDFDINAAVSMKTKYFRFTSKLLSKNCVAFIVLTQTLEDTASAIYQSGFGTSPYAAFFIGVSCISTSESSLISSMANSLVTDKDLKGPSTCTIAFFNYNAVSDSHAIDERSFVIFCYMCPIKPHAVDKVHVSNLNTLIEVSNKLNRNGYGRKQPMHYVTVIDYSNVNECIQQSDSLEDRKNFYNAFDKCQRDLVAASPIGKHLNTSFVLDQRNLSEIQLWESKWWFTIKIGEGFLTNPNENVYTRDYQSVLTDYPTKVVACVSLESLRQDNFGLEGIVPAPLILCLVLTILCLMVVYRNAGKSLDIVWPFLGIRVVENHPRIVIGIPLVCILLLSLLWQASISSSKLRIQEFPSRNIKCSLGYRIPLAPNIVKHLPMLINSMIYSYLANGMPLKDVAFDYTQHSNFYTNLSAFVDLLEKEKLFNFNWGNRFLQHPIWDQETLFNGKFVCKSIFRENEQFKSLRMNVRTWGNVAFKHAYSKWVEGGFMKRANHLSIKTKLFQTVRIENFNGLGHLKTITLNSPVGFACLLWFSANATFFIIWIVSNASPNIYIGIIFIKDNIISFIKAITSKQILSTKKTFVQKF